MFIEGLLCADTAVQYLALVATCFPFKFSMAQFFS